MYFMYLLLTASIFIVGFQVEPKIFNPLFLWLVPKLSHFIATGTFHRKSFWTNLIMPISTEYTIQVFCAYGAMYYIINIILLSQTAIVPYRRHNITARGVYVKILLLWLLISIIAAVSAIPDIEDRLSSRMRGGRNYN